MIDIMKKQLSRLEDDSLLRKNGALYIAFHTPTCVLPEWLMAEHPNNMGIILEKCFKDLFIGDTSMAVTVLFKGVPARLGIPYDRIFQMYDPATGGIYERRAPRRVAQIVSLEEFRKNRNET